MKNHISRVLNKQELFNNINDENKYLKCDGRFHRFWVAGVGQATLLEMFDIFMLNLTIMSITYFIYFIFFRKQ